MLAPETTTAVFPHWRLRHHVIFPPAGSRVVRTDSEVEAAAAEARCPECRHSSLLPATYRHSDGDITVVFTCPACGRDDEV